ncbi:Protein FYV4, mitochondrial [Cytospora mali]|uniref:Small ribosomal subunit protein mS41 n=1 Tax=Cytospora mali TaxID=578113 RepID=A0A194UYS2_CYTMA|nr:Protein FYV4, mitochondrial [Valsa mali var. pyri (nom. inval.)]
MQDMMKTWQFRSALRLLTRSSSIAQQPLQIRFAHQQASKTPIIPSPTPFVPDVKTFLTLIGRGMSSHTAKFPTWEALFSLTSPQLKELGIEPPRLRRYLIHWREKFRLGNFGPGGDIKHVEDGKAKLAITEVERGPLDKSRHVVNIPLNKKIEEAKNYEKVKVDGYHVEGTNTIAGPYALPIKGGSAALITITEGMWEEKRGRKIDGGERRREEVRFKRRVAERKAAREAMGFM